MSEDCYWFVDNPSETIKALCVECNKNASKKGWFWKGSEIGYGNYNLNCSVCDKILHKENLNEQKN